MFRRIADWLFEKWEPSYYARAFDGGQPVDLGTTPLHVSQAALTVPSGWTINQGTTGTYSASPNWSVTRCSEPCPHCGKARD